MLDPTAARLHGYLTYIGKKYPRIWQRLERLAMRSHSSPEWPPTVYLPHAAVFSALVNPVALKLRQRHVSQELLHDIALTAGLTSWRLTQGIYRFDPTLQEAVWPLSVRALPVQLLDLMPAPCVYIEAKAGVAWLSRPIYGAFIYREYDFDHQCELLYILLDQGDPHMVMAVPIRLGLGTLKDGLEAVFAESRKVMQNVPSYVEAESYQLIKEAVEPLISCLMYLCSENADYLQRKPQSVTHKASGSQKAAKAAKPPQQPTVIEVGQAVGRKMREARQQLEASTPTGTGGPMPFHWRGAHYQVYWHGSKKQGKLYPVLTLKFGFKAGKGSQDADVPRPAVIHKVMP
ncbi:hypothetical protein [Deinococcus xinjiangensis]